MPCVCQGDCRKILPQGSKKPYELGDKYCAVCKIFQEPKESNRCYCCNGRLRNKSTRNYRKKQEFVF